MGEEGDCRLDPEEVVEEIDWKKISKKSQKSFKQGQIIS